MRGSLGTLAATGMAAVAVAACAPGAPSAQPTPTVTAAPLPAVATAGGRAAMLAEARRFVFRVRNPSCLSTGTAFDFDGTVITNRHVAAGATTLQLSTWSGTDFAASVTGHSPSVDLAQLAAGLPAGTSAPGPGMAAPPVGTAVFVAGYPEGDQLTVTSGAVIAVTRAPGLGVDGPVLEISDRVRPGNSGSPLLDSAGRVVGVVFALDSGSGHGLAMPLRALQSFLAVRPATAGLTCTA